MCLKHYLLSFSVRVIYSPYPIVSDIIARVMEVYSSPTIRQKSILARCLCIPKFRETQPRFYEQWKTGHTGKYQKIPELLSIKLSLSRSVGTEKTRHLGTLRLSISSSFKMIASGTILTKGFLILLFSQLIFTTAGNYSMFNVIFFFGRLYVYCGSSDIFFLLQW